MVTRTLHETEKLESIQLAILGLENQSINQPLNYGQIARNMEQEGNGEKTSQEETR